MRVPTIIPILDTQFLESHRYVKVPLLLEQSLQSRVSFSRSTRLAWESSLVDESFIGLIDS